VPLPHPLVAPGAEGLVALAEHTDPWSVLLKRPEVAQDLAPLEDPLTGLALLAARARHNLDRLCNGEPLVGQILPYLRAGEGADRGLRVDRERGLLDPMREQREGVRVSHPRRYT
jgi:hypothetical protein